MKSDEQVVALIKGLTNEVNKNEGSGENVVLEAINECKREKSDFHSRLPKYFGTGLNLTNLECLTMALVMPVLQQLLMQSQSTALLTNLNLFFNLVSDAGGYIYC